MEHGSNEPGEQKEIETDPSESALVRICAFRENCASGPFKQADTN